MKNAKLSLVLATLFISGNAFAEDNAKAQHKNKMAMPEMTAEMRETMAKTHDEMAACLRSQKSIEECHSAMQASCPMSKDKKGCPMMGMKHDKGMEEDCPMHKKMKAKESEKK